MTLLRDVQPSARRALVCLLAITALSACDSGEPLVPTTVRPVGSTTIVASANGSVTPAPSVRLLDQRDRPLGNVLVTWQAAAASGTVQVDTVRTNASGVASSGGWQLGTRAGRQTLTATVTGLSPLVFSASVSPGPPALLVSRVPSSQFTIVGQTTPQPPALTLLDAFDNPIPDVLITFAVIEGGGRIVGDERRVTDASGGVALTGWRIGTRINTVQRLSASATGLAQPLLFDAPPLADSAVRIEPATALLQDGLAQVGVSDRPGVRARDQFDNPASGVTVTFTPAAGSGTVTGSTRVTDAAQGLARVGSWVLGSADEQRLVARSPQFPSDSIVFRANAVESLFGIQTAFLNGTPSPRNQQAVDAAINRWLRVIAGGLTPVPVFANADECGPGVPAINEVIPAVRIYINFDSIDGPGRILGRAGPCFIRTNSGLPVVGFVELDTADLANLNTNGTLDDVMTHEFGHVLGLQRFNWERRGLTNGIGTPDPFYQGAIGRDQFAAIGGATYTGVPVPLENTGGAGTRESHWRTSVLRREIMVGFAQAGGMPLSRLSVGSLADLGYTVRLDSAETFTVPSFGTAAFGAMVSPGVVRIPYGDDDWPSAIWSLSPTGQRQRVRAGDWRITRRGRPPER